MRSFLQNHKNMEMEIFAFCALTFEPIEVQTCSAPQNDWLNFTFERYHGSNGRKTDFYQLQILGNTHYNQ